MGERGRRFRGKRSSCVSHCDFAKYYAGFDGGGVFAFITSFDEVIVSIFLSGYATKTLPVKMWEEIRLEFTPVVAVGAVCMIALTILPFALHRLTEKTGKEAGK